jgi:hypothetical protein
VIAENRVGVLHEISKALSESGINIDSVVGYANGWNAIFRIVTPDIETAKRVLLRAPHVKNVEETEVVVVRLPDKPGELSKLTEKLHKLGIDLEVIYILSRDGKNTEVALKASELSADGLLVVISREL